MPPHPLKNLFNKWEGQGWSTQAFFSQLQHPASVWFLSARVASNRFPQLPCIINAYCSPRWQWQIGSRIYWLAVNVLFSHAWASLSPYCCQLDFSLLFPPLSSSFVSSASADKLTAEEIESEHYSRGNPHGRLVYCRESSCFLCDVKSSLTRFHLQF